MIYEYKIDAGDGRWLLCDGEDVLHSTPGDEIAIAFDSESGTLHKHGSPEMVERWAATAKRRLELAGFTDMAREIVVLRGYSYPHVGYEVRGRSYLHVDDVNKCISTSGYVLCLVSKLNAIDVPSAIISKTSMLANNAELLAPERH